MAYDDQNIFAKIIRGEIPCSKVYEDEHGCFPPAYVADASGRPMHSWRVLILPYLDQQQLYDQYDFSEPWNGPNNQQLGPPSWPGTAQLCPGAALKPADSTHFPAVAEADCCQSFRVRSFSGRIGIGDAPPCSSVADR